LESRAKAVENVRVVSSNIFAELSLVLIRRIFPCEEIRHPTFPFSVTVETVSTGFARLELGSRGFFFVMNLTF
jgi:hypothetical protein